MRYRPDIDGLRAIAVLAVIISHAEFYFGESLILPGGFFGVDIFFVISGYLITSIIYEELQTTSQFSFKAFYLKRARRLLPVLFVVFIACFPLAWFLLLPERLIDFSLSSLWSNFFASNFYWVESLQKYGAESSALKPLLHTWSLAIEEQFYVFYPIILVVLYRWLKPLMLLVLTVFVCISLIYAQGLSMSNPLNSFYLLPSRFWELLTGGVLPLINQYIKQQRPHEFVISSLPLIGLSLIVFSFAFIDFELSNHPGVITLFPVLGAAFIIGFPNEKSFTTQILSNSWLIYVGLISYSLYLWHFPVFVFLRIEGLFDESILKVGAILLVFVLAVMSYKLIEQPFRNTSQVRQNQFYWAMVICCVTVFMLNFSVIKNNGYPKRFNKSIVLGAEEMKEYRDDYWNSSNVYFNPDDFRSDKFSIHIIGNSWARDIANSLIETTKHEVSFDGPTGHFCKAITLNALEPNHKRYTKAQVMCEEENVSRVNQKLKNTDLVILADNKWMIQVDDEIISNEVDENVGIIRSNGYSGPIMVIANRPTFTKGIFDILNEYGSIGNGANTYAQKYLKEPLNKLLKQDLVASKHYNDRRVHYYSLVDSLCSDTRGCQITHQSKPLYFDKDHLTRTGAKLIGKDLSKYILDHIITK